MDAEEKVRVQALIDGFDHVRVCRDCGEGDAKDCGQGRSALAARDAVAALLATAQEPEVYVPTPNALGLTIDHAASAEVVNPEPEPMEYQRERRHDARVIPPLGTCEVSGPLRPHGRHAACSDWRPLPGRGGGRG